MPPLTDDGTTWTEITGAAGSGLPAGSLFDLVGDPNDANRFYASMRDVGIFRSDDGGVTWVNISMNDAGAGGVQQAIVNAQGNNNIEMAVAPNGRLYVAVLDQGQPNYIGFADNQGALWTAMDLPQTMESNGDTEGLNPRVKPGSQGAIHFSIVVDPTNSNIVYVAGDRQDGPFPNFIGARNFTGRIFRGNTTIAPTGAVPSPQWDHMTHSDNIAAIPGGGTANDSSPHADSREMVFDANGELIEVDDGGIYRRTSPGDNTGDWFSINGNLQVTEFHDIAYDTNSDIIIGGAQDTGTPQQTATGSVVWNSVSTADGGDVAVDVLSMPGMSIRYSSFQNLGAFRRITYDAGNNPMGTVFPGLNVIGGGAPLVPQFVTPVELNAIDPTRLIIGGANSTYESLDQAETLTEAGPGINVNRDAVAYGGRQGGMDNLDVLYVGSGGQVFVRTAAAMPLTATAYPGNFVRDIVLDPDDWATAYVIDSNQVFVTNDAGQNWMDVTGNLTDIDLRSVEFVPGVNDAVMVGGRDGVFRMQVSISGVWAEFGTGLPNAPVYDLDYDATDDVLVAGTLGRGAWTHTSIASLMSAPAQTSGTGFPEDFDPVADEALTIVNIGGPNDDTMLGGDGNDTLLAGAFDDSLNGGAGDDLLDGGGGNDIVEGGAGKDTLNGGDGSDLLDGGRNSDTVRGDAGNDTITWETGDGHDLNDGGLGFDEFQVNTGRENDRITVSAVGDGRFRVHHRVPADPVGDTTVSEMIESLVINSGRGADRITIEDLTGVDDLQAITINANGGFDTIDSSSQANTSIIIIADGGNGGDTITGTGANDSITGGNGADHINGGGGNDTIDGGSGVDVIRGGDGDDSLSGGDNRDFLHGEGGNDTLDGGAQSDDLFGGSGNDVIFGNAGADTAFGENGDDIIDGGDGDDQLSGGKGRDMLFGSAGADLLFGDDDDDTLRGGADGDTLNGGIGNDSMFGGDGTVALLDDGDDFLNGNAGNDTLDGERGQDTLLGGSGADELIGGFGNDQLNGNSGADSLRGGDGNDLMKGGTGDDRLNGGDGQDTLRGELGDDGLAGHDGADVLNGGDGSDTLVGGDGDDALRGGANLDLLIGGNGADELNGQGGNPDTLVGNDSFDVLDDNMGEDVVDNTFVFTADWIDAV